MRLPYLWCDSPAVASPTATREVAFLSPPASCTATSGTAFAVGLRGRVDALGAVAGKSRKMSAQAGNGFCNLSEMSTPSMHAGIVLTQIGGVASGKSEHDNSLFSAGSGRFDQPRKLSREHTHTMSDICYGAQV